jgi:hypothetical protein
VIIITLYADKEKYKKIAPLQIVSGKIPGNGIQQGVFI